MAAFGDLWTCPDCGRQFAKRNQTHTCAPAGDLARHLAGKPPEIAEIVTRIIAAAERCGPVTVVPEKTRIALQARMSFAALQPRRRWVDGHVVLARRREDPRFRRIETFSPRNHLHAFRIEHPGEVDEQVAGWLAEAYEVGMQRHLRPLNALEDLREQIRAHRGCGFEPCETATNMVPGEGSPTAELMLVGEAPGASEDALGRPFVGRAGRLLDELLAEAGLAREDVWITNVVKARPPKNRDPRAAEVAHCMPWLEAELALIQPRLVVPLGRHALAHFAPGARISEVHGTALDARGRALFPLYHPAAALHRQGLRETMLADARRLADA